MYIVNFNGRSFSVYSRRGILLAHGFSYSDLCREFRKVRLGKLPDEKDLIWKNDHEKMVAVI